MAPAANDKAYGKQLFAKPTANVPKKQYNIYFTVDLLILARYRDRTVSITNLLDRFSYS